MDDEFGTFYKIKLLYKPTNFEKIVEYHLSKKIIVIIINLIIIN